MAILNFLTGAFAGIIIGLLAGITLAIKLYEKFQEQENKILNNVKQYLEGIKKK